METWKVLGAITGILLLYVALTAVSGDEATPLNAAVAVVFGLFGLYLGKVISDRLVPDDGE